MNESTLERELREHYRTIAIDSSGRMAARMADAIDDAPARRFFGRPVRRPARFLAAAAAAVAVVTVLALVAAPLWRQDALVPAASVSPTPSPAPSPTAEFSPYVMPYPSVPPTVLNAWVATYGVTRGGVMWTVQPSAEVATTSTDTRYDLHVSSDNGKTWRRSTLPSVHTLSPIAAQASSALLPTTAPPNYCTDVYVIDTENVWACRGQYRTSDGGTTWQRTADMRVPADSWCTDASFVDALTGFVAFMDTNPRSGKILRTTDGGATWQTIAPTPASVLGWDTLLALDADTLWVGTFDLQVGPLLQVSRDGGATWTRVPLPDLGVRYSQPGLVIPTFLSQTEGFVTVRAMTSDEVWHYVFFRTRDAGRSWTRVDSLASDGSMPVFLDSQHWFRVVAGELRETRDAGLTWTAVADARDFAGRIPQAPTLVSPSGLVSPFATADGRHLMLVMDVSPADSAAWSYWADGWPLEGASVLFLSDDAGRTWRLADFSAR